MYQPFIKIDHPICQSEDMYIWTQKTDTLCRNWTEKRCGSEADFLHIPMNVVVDRRPSPETENRKQNRKMTSVQRKHPTYFWTKEKKDGLFWVTLLRLLGERIPVWTTAAVRFPIGNDILQQGYFQGILLISFWFYFTDTIVCLPHVTTHKAEAKIVQGNFCSLFLFLFLLFFFSFLNFACHSSTENDDEWF